MKRWLCSAVIAGYLSLLSFGLVSHTLYWGSTSHPLMYFIVWDMFCGWSSWSVNFHILGEGESGTFYRLAPGPWGEYRPWTADPRHNYDVFNNHGRLMALNCLKHTQHEPITRIYVIEETWPKVYDVTDGVWNRFHDRQPRDVHRYCRVLQEFSPEGQLVRRNPNWMSFAYTQLALDNPRLQQIAAYSKPMFVYDAPHAGQQFQLLTPDSSGYAPPGQVGSNLGN